ncbi:MAG TPA: carboxypeptidase-like regulatory domain-containing protein, partial [Chitinophagaceae bacterium]
MRRPVLLLLGILLFGNYLLAQSRAISGTVTDDKGNPIPIASVTIKGTPVGTTTNTLGEFKLTVPPNG